MSRGSDTTLRWDKANRAKAEVNEEKTYVGMPCRKNEYHNINDDTCIRMVNGNRCQQCSCEESKVGREKAKNKINTSSHSKTPIAEPKWLCGHLV